MARITTTLVVLLVLANGSVTVMETSGLTDDLGVTMAPGISDKADKIVNQMQDGFSPDSGVIQSLVSLIGSLISLFLLLIEATYAIPTMFINLGFPSSIVTVFFAPIYIFATLELAYVALGRRSV